MDGLVNSLRVGGTRSGKARNTSQAGSYQMFNRDIFSR